MNEWEWLTCEDPEAMTEYLDRLTFDWFRSYVVTTVLKTDAEKANLIREVVGNPFRPVYRANDYMTDPRANYHVHASAHIATKNLKDLARELNSRVFPSEWLTSSICTFSQSIIDSGDYGSVDVLADRLEEAGCDNEEILRHLRGEVRCAYDHIGNRRVDGDPAFSPNVCECGGNGWLPKPIPCQPGCWVLRLLTEFQRVDV